MPPSEDGIRAKRLFCRTNLGNHDDHTNHRRERPLGAFSALGTTLPAGAKLLRNAIPPERVPSQDVAILRDGDPGEPEILLSPSRYLFEHRAEIDIAVEAASAAERDAAFDALKRAIGEALLADRTLGGRCDYVVGEAPVAVGLPIEGAEGVKAATIGIVLSYATTDPLL